MSKVSKIYIQDWLLHKPYKSEKSADLYYLGISNKVKKALLSNPFILTHFNDAEQTELACFLVSYFEDIISGTRIWNSFIEQTFLLEDAYLPFYDCSNYEKDEINTQDIQFLIWLFTFRLKGYVFINPYTNLIQDTYQAVYEIFNKEFEFAPENEVLNSFYNINEDTDFDTLSIQLQNYAFCNYLISPDLKRKFAQNTEIQQLLTSNKSKEEFDFVIKHISYEIMFNESTNLLALKPSEWLAHKLGFSHPCYQPLVELTKEICVSLRYQYTNSDGSINVKDELHNKEYTFYLSKAFGKFVLVPDTIYQFTVVKWKNKWNVLLLSKPIQKEFDLFDTNKEQNVTILKKLNSAFEKSAGNSSLILLNPMQEESFLEQVKEDYIALLTEEEKENKKFEFMYTLPSTQVREKPSLVYFNPIDGLELIYGLNDAFVPDDQVESIDEKDKMINTLILGVVSPELAAVCMATLPPEAHFRTKPNSVVMIKHLDFVMRLCKNNHYHTQFRKLNHVASVASINR